MKTPYTWIRKRATGVEKRMNHRYYHGKEPLAVVASAGKGQGFYYYTLAPWLPETNTRKHPVGSLQLAQEAVVALVADRQKTYVPEAVRRFLGKQGARSGLDAAIDRACRCPHCNATREEGCNCLVWLVCPECGRRQRTERKGLEGEVVHGDRVEACCPPCRGESWPEDETA